MDRRSAATSIAAAAVDGAPHGLVITHRDRLAQEILAFARG